MTNGGMKGVLRMSLNNRGVNSAYDIENHAIQLLSEYRAIDYSIKLWSGYASSDDIFYRSDAHLFANH